MQVVSLPAHFTRSEGARVRESIALIFLEHYAEVGCRRAAPVPLTSGVDASVIFVGSAISVLKPLIVQRSIPEQGIALAQPSLRTHNAGSLLRPGFSFEWGGLFTDLALLAPIETMVPLMDHTLSFFLDALGFAPGDLRLRVSTVDADLLQLCRSTGRPIELEIDTHASSYYRHRIGMKDVVGRNFNFALRRPRSDEYRDVGNFIVFEDAERDHTFLEVGFGDTTILRAWYNLDHVLDCFPFPSLGIVSLADGRLLEDTVAVSVALWREGLRPSSRDSSSMLLAKYVRALYHVSDGVGLSLTGLEKVIAHYEGAAYQGSARVAHELVAHLSVNAERIEAAVCRTRDGKGESGRER
ncbi:MAG: hypothetical protein ACRDQ4_10805 [Pseudonocardiaceae bacterium]